MPRIDLPVPTSTLVALPPKFPKTATSVEAELAGTVLLVQEVALFHAVPVLFHTKSEGAAVTVSARFAVTVLAPVAERPIEIGVVVAGVLAGTVPEITPVAALIDK
jgi:hypothetical protein